MWVFLDGYKYATTGTAYKMTHTAGEVYVTLSGRNVGVYHFFGSKDEETEITSHVDTWTEKLIDLSDYFTNDPYYICNGPNCVYVFEEGTTSFEHDEEHIRSFVKISTLTHEIVEHVVLPQEAHCYPLYARFKLWFTTPAVADITTTGRQSLFYYDTLTEQWSDLIEVPGNKQFVPHKIHWGKQNWIFIDGYNENCVYKFSDVDGSYVSQIITNRKPTHMYTDGSRNLLVSSYNGMISTVDQTLNSYSNVGAVSGECVSFQFDGTYIWALTDALERADVSGLPIEVIKMDGDDKDYSIEAFSQTLFNDVIIVPPYKHNEWSVENQSISEVTEEQHIIVLHDNYVFIATTLRDSWTLEEVRPYYLDVKATAMIATGPEAYYGETE